jgi:hypothetical protein
MNFFNTLLLLSELGSKIGNVELKKNFSFHAKEFRKLNNLSFYNSLPEFDDEIPYIFLNGQKFFVGTILKRPLDISPVLSNLKVEFHYAVVLGTTTSRQEMLIEMAIAENIHFVTKQEFLVNRFKETDVVIASIPPRNLTRQLLIERAKNYEYDSYNFLDLNCKIFAESIVWEIKPPQRVKEMKQFQLQLCDLTIAMLNLQIAEPLNNEYKDHLTRRLEEAKKDKERLMRSLERL